MRGGITESPGRMADVGPRPSPTARVATGEGDRRWSSPPPPTWSPRIRRGSGRTGLGVRQPAPGRCGRSASSAAFDATSIARRFPPRPAVRQRAAPEPLGACRGRAPVAGPHWRRAVRAPVRHAARWEDVRELGPVARVAPSWRGDDLPLTRREVRRAHRGRRRFATRCSPRPRSGPPGPLRAARSGRGSPWPSARGTAEVDGAPALGLARVLFTDAVQVLHGRGAPRAGVRVPGSAWHCPERRPPTWGRGSWSRPGGAAGSAGVGRGLRPVAPPGGPAPRWAGRAARRSQGRPCAAGGPPGGAAGRPLAGRSAVPGWAGLGDAGAPASRGPQPCRVRTSRRGCGPPTPC